MHLPPSVSFAATIILFRTITATPVSRFSDTISSRTSTLNTTESLLSPFPALLAHGWKYHVPNTSTYLFFQHLPDAKLIFRSEYTRLLSDAEKKVRTIIRKFGDGAVVDGNFCAPSHDEHLVVGVQRWSPPEGPFTYGMVQDMLAGMYVYMVQFHDPIEFEVTIYQSIGTPSAYLTAMGFLLFTTPAERSRPGGPCAWSMPRNGTPAGLRMLGIS